MHTPLPFHSGNFPVSGSNDCQRVSFASNRSSCIPCRSVHMTLSRSKMLMNGNSGSPYGNDGQAEFHCGFQTPVMMPDVQHDECVDEVAFAQPTHVDEVFGRAGR